MILVVSEDVQHLDRERRAAILDLCERIAALLLEAAEEQERCGD